MAPKSRKPKSAGRRRAAGAAGAGHGSDPDPSWASLMNAIAKNTPALDPRVVNPHVHSRIPIGLVMRWSLLSAVSWDEIWRYCDGIVKSPHYGPQPCVFSFLEYGMDCLPTAVEIKATEILQDFHARFQLYVTHAGDLWYLYFKGRQHAGAEDFELTLARLEIINEPQQIINLYARIISIAIPNQTDSESGF